MFRSFEVRVDNLRTFLFPDVCMYKIKVMGLKLWDHEGMVKTIRAIRKKEVVILQFPWNITCLVIYCVIMYTRSGAFLKPPQLKIWAQANIPQVLEEQIVEYFLLILFIKYFECTRDDFRRLAFLLAVQN